MTIRTLLRGRALYIGLGLAAVWLAWTIGSWRYEKAVVRAAAAESRAEMHAQAASEAAKRSADLEERVSVAYRESQSARSEAGHARDRYELALGRIADLERLGIQRRIERREALAAATAEIPKLTANEASRRIESALKEADSRAVFLSAGETSGEETFQTNRAGADAMLSFKASAEELAKAFAEESRVASQCREALAGCGRALDAQTLATEQAHRSVDEYRSLAESRLEEIQARTAEKAALEDFIAQNRKKNFWRRLGRDVKHSAFWAGVGFAAGAAVSR